MLAWFISESDSCCWWDAAWLTMHSPGAHILLKEAKLNSIPQQNLRVLYNALTHENSLPTSSLNSLLCLLYCKHFLSLSLLNPIYLGLSIIWVMFIFLDFLLQKHYLVLTIQTVVLGKSKEENPKLCLSFFDWTVWPPIAAIRRITVWFLLWR